MIKKYTVKHKSNTSAPILTTVEKQSNKLITEIEKTEQNLQDLYDRMTDDSNFWENTDEIDKRIASYRRTGTNIRKAYIKIFEIYDELSARRNDIMRSKHKRIPISAPANGIIDLAEQRSCHFAKGLNTYKVLLICYIGSLVGVIIEMLWCLLTNGYIESRAGLVYGPFNLLYGVGAAAMTIALYRYRNHSRVLSFIGGMFIGSLVEYVCSWAQETMFGSRSWDYSNMPFNINGRICLLYSVFWGLLAVFWMKTLYPLLAKQILRIPNRFGKIITWALTIFFIINIIVSVISVFRWSQRLDGITAPNQFWKWIDSRFTDERMSRIYANMEF